MPLAEASIFRGCWDQMHMPVPIRDPLASPLRLAGLRASDTRGPRELQLKGIDHPVGAYAVQALA
jgi:hypothetical protein